MYPRTGGYYAPSIPMPDSPRDAALDEATWNHRGGRSARPAGLGVLEYLLQCESTNLQGFDNIMLKEVIATTSLYLWCFDVDACTTRQTMSSDARYLFCQLQPMLPKLRRKERVLRLLLESDLNLDIPKLMWWSFFVDSSSGAIGVVARDYHG
jgi:hypothetical protein